MLSPETSVRSHRPHARSVAKTATTAKAAAATVARAEGRAGPLAHATLPASPTLLARPAHLAPLAPPPWAERLAPLSLLGYRPRRYNVWLVGVPPHVPLSQPTT